MTKRTSLLQYSKFLIGALAAIVFFSSPVAAEALAPLDPQIDEYKPILVDGDNIPAALGKRIETLSLQAVIDGQMEPVPFQIDEYNTGGAVYFKEWNVPIDGSEGVLDTNDKLLFLFKDAGARRETYQVMDGKALSEIELTDDTGAKRYVYLVEGSRLRSEEQYVRYSTDIGQVETDFYSLTYNKKNQLNWDEFSYAAFKGEKPLDTMKIRLNGGLFTEMSTITLNNKNFIAKPTGEHVGPVRTTSQMEITMWMFNLPILEISYQVHHYPKSMLYDVRVVMPEVRRKILANPMLSMSLDANNLLECTLRTELGPKQAAIVDGVMSPLEQEFLKSSVTPEHNWLWLSTHRDLDVLAFFNYLGETREPLSLVYADDLNLVDPPERFKGLVPNAGYRIDNFPMSGFFGFVVSLYLSEGYEGKPEKFSEAVRSMPTLRVLEPSAG